MKGPATSSTLSRMGRENNHFAGRQCRTADRSQRHRRAGGIDEQSVGSYAAKPAGIRHWAPGAALSNSFAASTPTVVAQGRLNVDDLVGNWTVSFMDYNATFNLER